MDGGARQDEMAERFKLEVKENAHRRRGERAVHDPGAPPTVAQTGTSEVPPQGVPMDLVTAESTRLNAAPDIQDDAMELEPSSEESAIRLQRGADCTLARTEGRQSVAFGRSETILFMFYLETLLPFLFPFYRPPLLQGGRAWVLEMMISSPVVRHATLCQSSYFFALTRGTAPQSVVEQTILMQTKDAFKVLRESLQVIDGSSVTEHLYGAVRIMASILQVQRFEITVLSFKNCQVHLNAALALFRQLFENSPGNDAAETTGEQQSLSFNAVVDRLGPPTRIVPTRCCAVPSAEQAAFRFSSALLILDDIVASTVLQEQPRLYEYHRCLLLNEEVDGTMGSPPINLETVIGCQNWALLHIGEIAALDAWKQQCKRTGSLNVIELVHRATAIKEPLEAHLKLLENETGTTGTREGDDRRNVLMNTLAADYFGQQSNAYTSQSSLVTRVWAHAALVYLLVVVSGWQPVCFDVRYHVSQIIELLTHQISSPALLRTMVWPFCVAGCLAEPAEEAVFRGMVDGLHPPIVFGTVRKALEIMEGVWRNREAGGDAESRDLATCFRNQGEFVLLV